MMFMRKSTMETLLTALASTSTKLEAELQRERDRNHQLLDTIVQMKREGFHPVAVMPPAREEGNLLPKVIEDALDELGLIGTVRAQHEAWAQRQLTRGRDAAIVAHEILQGGLEQERGSEA
jgi:hypothetical protein